MATEFEVVLKLEDQSVVKGLAAISSKAESAASTSENAFMDFFKGAESGVTKLASAFSLIGVAVDKALAAVALPFELIQLNDQVQTVNKSFAILADQAGVSGTALKSGLEQAAGGVVDLEDVLQASNRALVELGDSSARLPEVLEIARKAGKAFGVDTLDAYEALNQAIISGNTRQLKSIGIIIDSDRALKEYAKSLGKTTEQLTLAEKQQALLSATIKEGQESFKGIGVSSGNLTESVKRLSVAWEDFKESVATSKGPIGRLGIFVTDAVSSVLKGITEINDASGKLTPDNAEAKLRALTAQLKFYNDELEITKKQTGEASTQSKALEDAISKTMLAMSAASDLLEQTQRSEVANISAAASEKEKADALALTNAEIEKQIEYRKKLAEWEAQQAAASAANTQVMLAGAVDVGEANLTVADSFRMIGLALDEQARSVKITFADVAKTLRETFLNGLTQSFAALGNALATSANEGEAFGDSWKKTLGGLAIQLGQFFLLVGTGMSASGALLGLSGGAAIAAGLALTTLGGYLQGQAGAKTDTGTVGDTGGGITTTDNLTTDLTRPEQLERQDPTAQIAVSINGPVLGDESAGRTIVEYINKAFDATGVQVRQGVMA